MGSRVRADGSGDSRRDGGLSAESSGCAESSAGAESLSARKNLPERKMPSRRFGIASVGCDIWTIITVINCTQGVASICIKLFSGSDYCVTISVGFT